MNGRTAVITALAVTILGSLYLIYTPSSITFHMSPTGVPASENIPGLEFKLSQISKNPPSLLVTLRNNNPSSTFTVLKWGTPLDPQASNLGIFKMFDADTGKEVLIDRLMINRKMPPSREDLHEIAPGTEHATEVVFNKPWMPAKKPAKYQIKVEGQFKAVWEKTAREVGTNELEELGGSNVLINRPFQSEEVLLTVE
ncbi:uncharacterized protein BDR25DRAFT_214041 [Lindgomyces ingoldianus]|uniref:Uncharacterized protein n=1 Tax=Lindgomyces ingoldianus TaxID=673940 RepID=A0ACB6R9K7_9PLEO|nr:uncharacterized protein BDR25DRAFT_214041 [Lindgomyces ingoldianus]KAF2475197.1 hypothetical protein BDR25DRAFT_214041 [Lindgomyces ingoldianus]